VLLDFDGTLALLEDRPSGGTVSSLTRGVLARLARRTWCDVAVISAGAMQELKDRVGLQDLVYVGNHGFEITGPGWAAERRDAAEVRTLIAGCGRRLRDRLRGIRGVAVEDKGTTTSIDYRLVRREQADAVREAVLEEVAQLPPGRVEIRRGKMVLELRPAMDWDKGRAAVWLLEQLAGRDWRDRCIVLYAGNDPTDEDAFLALGDAAVTIRLGTGPSPTAARYMVTGMSDLTRFLQTVLAWDVPSPAAGEVRAAAPR
jgi:trehalose-phosphatase